jgi:cytochrome c biogenesis protein CcdA
MIVLVSFSFAAGIITILSPCILPILPILLSGSARKGSRTPLGMITGFVLSFSFFTLMIAKIVQATGASPEVLRVVAAVMIGIFGISMLIPRAQALLEMLFSRFSNLAGTRRDVTGYWGGVYIGLSLGLVWTPCVGPIMASVITLAASGAVTMDAVTITVAYSLGTAVPMLAILYGGQNVFKRINWFKKNSLALQRVFAGLMVVMAVGFFFNIDRRFQSYILDVFPEYGAGITKIEEVETVERSLEEFSKNNKL